MSNKASRRVEGTEALSQALNARGCAAIHVTTGGVSPEQASKLVHVMARSFRCRGELIRNSVRKVKPPVAAFCLVDRRGGHRNGREDASFALARQVEQVRPWPRHGPSSGFLALPRSRV